MSPLAYGESVAGGGVVASVADGSPAARAGIAAGERIVAVDGQRLRDVLDWRWVTSEGAFTARVERQDGRTEDVRVEPRSDETPGIGFDGAIFDGVRECANACEFCFVSQLPPGLRPSLYVRDDDFRLSFLLGNFVTLTNLDDGDVDRILEQRLSPLYVSLHAVEEGVRRSLVCPSVPDRAIEHAERLLAGGITLHAQIVLVPGRNDGEVLQRTLTWLSRHQGVGSVGVVPLGFTGHQTRYTASYGDAESAGPVLDALEPWRARMRAERGTAWVWAADELYLAAGRDVPPADDYGEFPQYENGIGMVRTFVDAWRDAVNVRRERPEGGEAGTGAPVEVTLVTGELFAPVLRALAPEAAVAGVKARVAAVPNLFLAGNVSVAGLLTARDLAGAIRAEGARGIYLVPDALLNSDGLTLDDVAADALPTFCAADVRVVSSDAPDPLGAIRAAALGGDG